MSDSEHDWLRPEEETESETIIDARTAQNNPEVADVVAKIASLRQSIDNVDTAIVSLLAERFKYTSQVGVLKARAGFAPADYQREHAQIERLHRIADEAGLDPEIAEILDAELSRQQNGLEMIASENFVPRAVLQAQGSVLTNKYAEGYPGRRYYGGCEDVDIVENIARDRAKKLFGAKFANVQPHSGAQANIAVYFALLNPGDTVMGMNLAEGGHLTHGSPVNLSGKYFNFVPYGINEEGYIDYDELEQKALSCKPKMIVAGASAYPRIIDFKRISEIAKKVGAYLMVDMAHIAGLVAAGLHPSPVPYADVVTTTTHKTLRGPRGGMILCIDEEIA